MSTGVVVLHYRLVQQIVGEVLVASGLAVPAGFDAGVVGVFGGMSGISLGFGIRADLVDSVNLCLGLCLNYCAVLPPTVGDGSNGGPLLIRERLGHASLIYRYGPIPASDRPERTDQKAR